MKRRIVRLTESDLRKIVKRVLSEEVETEEGVLDSNSLLFGDGGTKNEIRWDLKREKNKNALVRKLIPNKAIDKNYQEFNDLVYGYNNFNDKVVAVKYRGKYDENTINYGLMNPKRENPKSSGGDINATIYYSCNENDIAYTNLGVVDEEQKSMDMNWLDPWCEKIDWKSRIGKNKGLFRKQIRRF